MSQPIVVLKTFAPWLMCHYCKGTSSVVWVESDMKQRCIACEWNRRKEKA